MIADSGGGGGCFNRHVVPRQTRLCQMQLRYVASGSTCAEGLRVGRMKAELKDDSAAVE